MRKTRTKDGGGASEFSEAIEADGVCGRRLTNLFVAYPHARIEQRRLHLDTPSSFGPNLMNTIELARLLAEDLDRAARRLRF